MPTASIKTNIKLDGEKEYKAAVGEINTALGTLDSKLKLLKNTYAENKDNVEGLTKINETLNEKILIQKEKISALEDALKNAAQEYGESDARTQKWQQQLNKANSTLIDMERELRDNTDALKDAGVEADNFSGGIEELNELAGASVDELGDAAKAAEDFGKATDDSKKKSDGFGGAVENLAGDLGIKIPPAAQKAATKLGGVGTAAGAVTVTVAALGAAVVAAEKKLISMTKKSAAFADNILTMSMTTGLSTEQLQEFSYAAELIDVSVDTLQTSLTKLTNNMQNAMNGTGDAMKAFDRLGVSVTDANGNMRRANDVFYDAIDALGDVQNATERDALAMDIFGRSAQDLNPLIIQGSGTLREYANEAHNAGYVLDNETLSALGAVDDGVQRLQTTQEAFHNKLSAEFAPYLTELLDTTREQIDVLGDALVTSGVIDGLGMILDSVGGLLSPVNELSDSTVPNLVRALEPLATILAVIADLVQFFGGIGSFILTAEPERFIRAFDAFNINPDNPSYSAQMRDLIDELERKAAADKYEENLRENRQSSSFGTRSGFGSSLETPKLDKVTSSDYLDTALNINKFGKVSNADAASRYRAYLKDNSEFLSYDVWKKQRGYNAAGTDYWYGGRTLIGENGPEMAILPQGTRILTAQESRQAGGGDTYYITIDAKNIKELNDVVRIAKNHRRLSRMEGAL